MQSTIPKPVFINLEYLFFLITRFVARVGSYIFTAQFFYALKAIATIVVILLITVILYCLIRFREMENEKKKAAAAGLSALAAQKTTESLSGSPEMLPTESGTIKENPVWESIRAKILSDNQSDWRLAIIEADIYMDRLLDDAGYHGETVGDKLKQITPTQLASVQIAWEAHKVRNRIAHEGEEYTLTMPEARRVLSYFEIVFRDLGAIA